MIAAAMYEPKPLAIKNPKYEDPRFFDPFHWVLTRINNGLQMDKGQFQKLCFMRAVDVPESEWETLSDYVTLRNLIAFNALKADHPVSMRDTRGLFDALIALDDEPFEEQVAGLLAWCKEHRIEVTG